MLSSVGEVSYVELYKDDSGRPRGAGVIEFANEETAQKAIEKMHRYSIGERSIIVKEVCIVKRRFDEVIFCVSSTGLPQIYIGLT